MVKPNWSPSPTDTMSLAAIRWFACTMEAYAIELYATDRSAFPHIEKVMRKALKDLGNAKVKPIKDDDDCPDGYIRCGDLCKPACFMDDAPGPRKG
jgi:hypothetical protein